MSVYNYSSTILANFILASIDCERDLLAPLQYPEVKTNGRTLLYLVKETLMTNASSLTDEVKNHIRYLPMSGKDYLLWKEYIDDIISARQQIENLSAYVDDAYLFTLFKNKFGFALQAIMGSVSIPRISTNNFYQEKHILLNVKQCCTKDCDYGPYNVIKSPAPKKYT